MSELDDTMEEAWEEGRKTEDLLHVQIEEEGIEITPGDRYFLVS